MLFCPVCGVVGVGISPRCERVALYYGYARDELDHLSKQESSIAVPFFDIKRFFFALESLAQNPLARAMVQAVEDADPNIVAEEFGNSVRVLPFADPAFPHCTELYVKEDVSKTMVVYQHEDAIEHVGSEERAVLFAEVADRFFGLAQCVPTAVCGLSRDGTKFVASAGLSKQLFVSLHDQPRSDLVATWNSGVLAQIALLDFVLGQNDRSPQNVLFSSGIDSAVGLIDNDDAFVKHERLVAPFAYLAAMADHEGLHLGVAGAWFSSLRLAKLISLLCPLGLPEETVMAVCRRFVFARHAVATRMPLAQFMASIFVERPPLTWNLQNCPWVLCRTVVAESKDGTLYRTYVGENLGETCEVVLLEGKLLDFQVKSATLICKALSGAIDVDDAVESLIAADMNDGFVHVIRRRFFVSTQKTQDLLADTVRIVEVRSDPAGFHVVVRKGGLSRYATRQIDSFVSFQNKDDAVKRANEVETALLAQNFIDLRGRLEAFKAPPTPVIF